MSNQQLYERFYYSFNFSDTTPDLTLFASLEAHVIQWQTDHPEYVVQWNSIQPDIIRYPATGQPYAEIIWYAEPVS